jgi:hypothetical protein
MADPAARLANAAVAVKTGLVQGENVARVTFDRYKRGRRRGAVMIEMLSVTRVPHDPGVFDTGIDAWPGVLWYNVFAANDGVAKLTGQPYDNNRLIYFGSQNDWRFNYPRTR